ncbi:MAG: S8 family serine peptidase, partial [Marinoscillum sp.]
AFDVIANELPQLLHVFSSGNSGLEISEEGTYTGIQGYGNLTGNFKSAKNILLVGSVDTLYRSLDFISRGPGFDGRVKPDLSAYSMVGSSNSAALVSGTAALLQQSYVESHNEFPLSDLLKAILICTSTDIDAPGPDHIRGFGNLNAFEALELLNANRYWQDTLSNGEEITFELNVPTNVSGLKVVLAWIDPPANPGDHVALINDLNVELIDPSGEHYLPWVLKTDADIQKLKEPATRGLDSLNNVEMVSIDLPAAGVYRVNVTSRGLISRDQGFSLAYALDTIGQFDWDYPGHGDNFPYNGETGTYFRWSNTFTASTGLLQFQLEEENVWSTIAEVDLSVDHYRWNQVPLDQNSLARARMIISSDTFYTESFTLSRQLGAGVGFNCHDSIELKWDNVTDAIAYNIYQPGEKYLELSHQVNTNSIILSRDEITSDYFSIEPVRRDGVSYLPSYTIDY